MAAFVGLLMTAVWIGALIDAILTPSEKVLRMPKVAWVLLIVFLTVIGAILWFALGRERGGQVRMPRRLRTEERTPRPARDAPAPTAATTGPVRDLRSTEQQLEDLDREIEFHRRQAELRARQAERPGQVDPIQGTGSPAS